MDQAGDGSHRTQRHAGSSQRTVNSKVLTEMVPNDLARIDIGQQEQIVEMVQALNSIVPITNVISSIYNWTVVCRKISTRKPLLDANACRCFSPRRMLDLPHLPAVQYPCGERPEWH